MNTPVRIAVVIASAVVGLFFSAASAIAEEVSDFDRFQLWNNCRPMELFVGKLTDDATDIGLTHSAITVAVRSRLRAARLYSDDTYEAAWSFLYVDAHVFRSAFGIDLSYNKYMTDAATKLFFRTEAWNISSTGTHGQSPDYIVSSVSQYTDQFIDEYLRVNADACRSSN